MTYKLKIADGATKLLASSSCHSETGTRIASCSSFGTMTRSSQNPLGCSKSGPCRAVDVATLS